jgi:adenylate cyclase class IV
MPVSIEVRTRVDDLAAVLRRLEELTAAKPVAVEQEDKFFDVKHGRLMIRREGRNAELIFYVKSEDKAPRSSTYYRRSLNKADLVESELAERFGIRCVVRKRRWSFDVLGARVNVDTIDPLGSFLEVGAPASRPDALPRAFGLVRRVLKTLDVNDERLVAQEYITLLEASGRC